MGPQISELPHPARNTANRTEPANTTDFGEPSKPDLGNNSVSAGVSTKAKMKESIPSSVHPAHAAQKPRACAELKRAFIAVTASLMARLPYRFLYNDAKRFRSSFFCTFPMVLRGSSSTSSTRFGTL